MGDPTVGEISFGQRLLLSLPPPSPPSPTPFNDFPRSAIPHDGFWPCVARTRVHMCVYIYYVHLRIYVCIHSRQIHAFQRHTRHRPIVDSTADLWVDRSKRGGNDSSFSLSSPFGSRSFLRTKRLAGFSFFFSFSLFWNRFLSLPSLRPISRYNKRGHEDFGVLRSDFPRMRRASLRNSGTRLLHNVIYFCISPF